MQRLLFLLIVLISSTTTLVAQSPTRILFLLDASGSMNQKIDQESRWKVASRLLYNLADSLEKKHSPVQIAVRVFGHQSPNATHNCEDSKLEIPFAKSSAKAIQHKLKSIHPQGYTPIAYSIFKAAESDFPTDKNALNAIVLITDGVETCGGDPCAATQLLERKRISLKPFIIGLGLQDSFIQKFNCVGPYFDAKTSSGFNLILRSVVAQIMNTTTLQINLLNAAGEAKETNIELTLCDAYSGDLKFAFVHAKNEFGISDTLRVDPIGKYTITAHTFPPVILKDVVLTPGRHNVFGIDVPQGSLQLTITGTSTPMAIGIPVSCVVRKSNQVDIVHVQDFNGSNKYLTGEYDLEILSLPEIEMRGVLIGSNETKNITIPASGNLNVFFQTTGMASIYTTKLNRWQKVYDWGNVKTGAYELNLQPGEYDIVFKSSTKIGSESTYTKHVVMESGKVIRVKL